MKIGLLSDSTCDLNPDIIEKYNIGIVPLSIHFSEDEIYQDRFDIEGEDFFNKMIQSDILPTTSQPAIGLFIKKYQEMAKEYDVIISIHLSSKLSGTPEAAMMAANQLEEIDIRVIDSLSASYGIGFLVLLAARMIEKGYDIEEILKRLEEARKNTTIYFTVNDLTYLHKGGRIDKTQAFLGSVLNVYPIITLDSGKMIPVEKVRGKRKIAKRISELTMKCLEGEEQAWFGFVHGTDLNIYSYFRDLVEKQLKGYPLDYKIATNWISAVIGCHTGPSVYGLVILKGDFLKI